MLNQKAVQLFKVLWNVSKNWRNSLMALCAFISLICKKIYFNEMPASYDFIILIKEVAGCFS